MSERYIVITGRAEGSERDGFRVVHRWDRRGYTNKAAAVDHGFYAAESDDFNIGVVRDDRLAELWWMDKQITEDAATLARIGREIGLEG